MESETEQPELEAEDWELEEGIPQPSDPFIQKYFDGRDALIAQEDKHRSDRDFKDLLSPMAQEACAIVGQIRFEEQQTVWTQQLEDEISKNLGEVVHPGMMFSLAKDRVEKTKLWNIIRKMPKGALLHCHLEAMVDQKWLFEEALRTEGIHIAASKSLHTAQSRSSEPLQFRYKKQPNDFASSIWDVDYISNTLIPLNTAANTFPEGERDGFLQWLLSRCAISVEEALSLHQGIDRIWSKFLDAFAILRTLVYYEPLYRKFLARMLTQLADDGIQYVDMRAAFAFEYYREGEETPEEGYNEVIRVFGEEIERFKKTEAGQDFWGARMIWTAIRKFDNRSIWECMKHCIDTKIAHPHLIAGFDFVGQEDPGRPLADLTPLVFWFRKSCAEAGVNIPFFFHAGETFGTGTEADLNLFDAVLLGSRRLGHAFSLYKHPLLMNMVRDKRICVECCPISNEILRLTTSVATHPLPSLLAQGIPVALGNDDPAILGQDTAGLSHDFYQVLQVTESLGLEGLGCMAENSVRWAAFEDLDPKTWTEDVKMGMFGNGVRAARMKEWKRSWEKFCQWIIVEFSVDINVEPEE